MHTIVQFDVSRDFMFYPKKITVPRSTFFSRNKQKRTWYRCPCRFEDRSKPKKDGAVQGLKEAIDF